MLDESLLEALFTGWIDTLADDHRLCTAAYFHHLREGGNDCMILRYRSTEGKSGNSFDFLFDILRCGSAAAAETRGTDFRDGSHEACKCFRIHVVNSMPVH